MALYSEKVMDHFRNPRNVGVIEDADGVGEVGNAKCGDIMKMYLKIDNDIITDVKFETFGAGSGKDNHFLSRGTFGGDGIRQCPCRPLHQVNGLNGFMLNRIFVELLNLSASKYLHIDAKLQK